MPPRSAPRPAAPPRHAVARAPLACRGASSPGPALRLALLALLLVAAVLPTGARAAEGEGAGQQVAPALEGWRYRWGDPAGGAAGAAPAWAAESGEAWEPTDALGMPPGREGRTLLWLSVPVPRGPWESPGLLLPSVSNVLEVYAGGERVYASGTLAPAGVETIERSSFHVVPLPRAALGTRVLLRVQSSGKAIGVRGEVLVGERDALRALALRGGMDVFVLGALLLFIAALAAAALLARGQLRQFGSLLLFSGGTGLLLAFISGVPQALWGVGRPGFVLMLLGAYVAVPGLFGFVCSAVLATEGRRLMQVRYAQYAAAAVFSLALLFVHGSLPTLFPVFLVLMLASLCGCAALAVREARAGNPDARIFLAGVAALLLAGGVTALTSLGVVERAGFVMHWGLLGLCVALLAILARRALALVGELQARTSRLEAQQREVQLLAGRMGDGAVELLDAVGQLRATSAVQNAGLGLQATSLQEAQTTVAEIRQTSQLTAEKAMLLAAAASDADDAGREGLAALERTLGGLEAIRVEVAGMAQRIHALEARAREIASVVDAVKNLADQSNMLALNAAIEAVRSGEHGKGFSVVAREVRNLADQSIDATERIREILDSVGSGMREAAGASARGEERVRQSVQELEASGEQLRRLAVIVAETGGSVRQISAAVAQQDAGTSQIATAITELSAQMGRTLQALEQTEGVTRSVERLAQAMSDTAAQVGTSAPAPQA
jgi:methyl-accepting chemotaxis protein